MHKEPEQIILEAETNARAACDAVREMWAEAARAASLAVSMRISNLALQASSSAQSAIGSAQAAIGHAEAAKREKGTVSHGQATEQLLISMGNLETAQQYRAEARKIAASSDPA